MTLLCPSCGQRLSRRADHCPACGASAVALPIENAYEPIGADPLVTMGGGGKGRRGWLLAAALVVALGIGALVAGRATDGATSAATTTTTTTAAAPTTTVTPSTTRPTSSTTALTTTTTGAITSTGGAVLPEPTGQSLYTASATGDVYRVDLDTGAITHSDVGRAFQSPTIVPFDNGALITSEFTNSDSGIDQETVMYFVRVDGTVDRITVRLPSNGRAGAPGFGVWLYSRLDPLAQTFSLVTANGETALTLTLPPGAQNFVPDGDGIVFMSGSGTYRVDALGIHRIATGELIALSDRYLVTKDCDASYVCAVVRTDRASGQADVIGPPPAGITPSYQSGTVSPDGNFVAILVFGYNEPPTERIYDLGTNTIQDTNGQVSYNYSAAQAWTASGFSAITNDNSTVTFTRGTDNRSVVLPSTGSLPIAFAIGPTPIGAGNGPP